MGLDSSKTATSLGDSKLSFFSDEVIDRSDLAYRFALALVLDKMTAFNLVKKTFSNVVADIEKYMAQEDLLHALLTAVWTQYSKRKPASGSLKFVGLNQLPVEQRAAVFLIDVVGFSHDKVAEVLSLELSETEELIGKSRQYLLNSSF